MKSLGLSPGRGISAPGRLRTVGGTALPCAGADRRGGMQRATGGYSLVVRVRANDRSGFATRYHPPFWLTKSQRAGRRQPQRH